MREKNTHICLFGIFIFLAAALLAGCSGGGGGGGGGTGGGKTGAPEIVQTIPPTGSDGISPESGILIFFDDVISASTVNSSTVQIKHGVSTIFGQYFTATSQAGNTIVTFVPSPALPEGSQIDVLLPASGGVQDAEGLTLASDYGFSFDTGTAAAALTGNLGFESGATGLSLAGDCNWFNSDQGVISPNEGEAMIAASSGEDFEGAGVISSTPALNYTTSVITTGEIATGGKSQLRFDYDFVSAEFDEFVGSEFDDTFAVVITGPGGVYAEIVASVNTIGMVGTPITLPTSYTDADPDLEDAGHTGWVTKTIDISSLGTPIHVAFVVSDVSDEVYTTIVFIDNLRFP